MATAQERRAEISEQFTELRRDFGPRTETEVWVGFTYGDCEIEPTENPDGTTSSCECEGWDWSALFHAQAAFSGSPAEVTRWLLRQPEELVDGVALCDRDAWEALSSQALPTRIGRSAHL